jgi:hypothetical protein
MFMLATVAVVFRPGEPVAEAGVYTCDGPCRHTWIAHTRAADVVTRRGQTMASAAYPGLAAGCRGSGWVRGVESASGWAEIPNRMARSE